MTTSEPTTGEIVRALRFCAGKDTICGTACPAYLSEAGCRTTVMKNAADRLESQEQAIEELKSEAIVNALENAERIANLTARAERAEAREKAIIRCSECARLDVINSDIVYAQCKKYAFVFFPFEADTRETGCTHGERGLPQEGEGV